MRILQIQLHSGTGGAESVARTLEEAWRDAGITVRTLALSDADSGHAARAEGWRGTAQRLKRAREGVRSFQPDIIVAHATIAGMYARLGAALGGYKRSVLVVGHSASDDYADPRVLAMEMALSLARPAVWLCVSETVRRDLLRRPIRGRRTSALIGNPISTEFMRIQRSPVPGRVLMLGRVVPQKDLLTAVTAIAAVKRTHPVVDLVIAGEIEDETYLRAVVARIKDLDLEASVTFMGRRNDVPELLSAAHVLLHTAVREAASQTLREAFAAGVPIVASDEAMMGVPDVTPFGTFPAGDSQAAAEGLRDALDSSEWTAGPTRANLAPAAIAEAYLSHWAYHQRGE